jgi:hypothetical protein
MAAKETIAIKKAESFFDRTNAALDYVDKKHPLNKLSNLKSYRGRKEFIKQVKLLLPADTERACLLEIYKLESETFILLKKLYPNQAVVTNLYKEGIKAYKQIQEIFSLPESDLLKIKISRPEHYKLLKTKWHWKLDFKKQVHALVERNFNEGKSAQPVLLLPDELQHNVKEYYLDELDLIIFNTLQAPFIIAEILPEMKQYFPPEEIEENYPVFKQLIINTIKGMLYADAIKINF